MSSQEKRDIYYRLAKDYGLRARSAFKLLEIHNQYDILSGVSRVVDLCAAPGSWSQVLSQRLSHELNKPPTIIAVDVQKVAEIPNVIHIEGDITRTSTLNEIMLKLGGGKADLVICDGAPDVTGVHDLDIYLQSQLILSSLMIVIKVLKKGGNFVTKIFRGRNINPIILQLKTIFKNVSICKPSSSRMTSFEAFAVCQDFLECENDLDFHNNPYYKPQGMNDDDLVVMYAAIKQRFNSDTNYALDISIEEPEKKCDEKSIISAIDKCDRILKNDADKSDEQLIEVKKFEINEMEWSGLFNIESMFSHMNLNTVETNEVKAILDPKQVNNNFKVSVDAILSNYSLLSPSPPPLNF